MGLDDNLLHFYLPRRSKGNRGQRFALLKNQNQTKPLKIFFICKKETSVKSKEKNK